MMRKRYKYSLVLLVVLAINVVLFYLNKYIGISFFLVELLLILCFFTSLVLNEAVKHTNWYKNVFVYTKQMCSNEGYRDYLIRNLDIVNVGSNPARFAFHYNSVLGENWSTGNQGLDMDFEILKFRHSFIKKGGIVLLPLVAFSGVSGYLKKKPQYSNNRYYAKFAYTLDPMQVSQIPEVNNASHFIHYPLFEYPKSLKNIIFDEQPDNRLTICEMPLMYPQLIEDARHMVDSWLNEFGMKSLEEPLGQHLIEGMELSASVMREMIDFLTERELRPVIILPPMSEPLQRYFNFEIKKKLIYDFVDKISRPNVLFLDYSNNVEFQNPDLYFSSLFMNLRGRVLFTNKVIEDLKIGS